MNQPILKNITLRQIAEKASVSTATVDRVVSGRAQVSARTKSAVLNAIEELQGTPSVIQNYSALRPLKITMLMEAGLPFLNLVQKKVDTIKTQYARLGIEVVDQAIPNFNLESFNERLDELSRTSDGIILMSRESPVIANTVDSVTDSGTPIVCLHTDLPGTKRIGYAGMNHTAAGKIAARLMGRFTQKTHGEIILLASARYSCQYERETGFRRVIREEFPHLTIRESINNHDLDHDSYSNLSQIFKSGSKPVGVYNLTGGTAGVCHAIDEAGIGDEVLYIAHELDDVSAPLLSQGKINVVIHQDLRSEIITALNGLLFSLGAISERPNYRASPPLILTRENLGDPLEIDIPISRS